MSGSKGVDIIASSDKFIHMIEVKNCVGDEKNNIWRIVANNKSYLIMIRIDIKKVMMWRYRKRWL